MWAIVLNRTNRDPNLGKKLIDNGVRIVFGHSAHHIPQPPIQKYKNGLIIYGLGDFINDYSINNNFKSDESLMCQVDTVKSKYKLIPIKRKFFYQSSIPIPINSHQSSK